MAQYNSFSASDMNGPWCWSAVRLLNETEGSLLDDEHLLITLQTSKTTSQDIKEQLETSEETEEQIDTAREVLETFLDTIFRC